MTPTSPTRAPPFLPVARAPLAILLTLTALAGCAVDPIAPGGVVLTRLVGLPIVPINVPDTAKTDTTTAPTDTMPSASGVHLPRSMPLVPDDLDDRACTVRVGTGELQGALNAARGGDVLCLAGTYQGTFTVPPRVDPGWVVIRSASTIPPGRMRPSTAPGLARIVSANRTTPLTFAARATRTMLLGVEVTTDSTMVEGPVALVQIGTAQERLASDLPTDIVLQQVYLHGWPRQHVRRAVAGNGGAQTLRDSWCEEIHASGFDSQCWISWNASGPILIENNTLEAASENVMFGGADPRVPGLVPSDVTIRRNHIAKPLAWKGANWNVKNLIETKSSARVLVEQNVIEGSWTDGQTGYAFVLKSTSQNLGCPACGTSDWTIRRNLVRQTGAGFSIAGRADQNGVTVTDSSNRRFAILENWIGPLNVAPFEGDARPMIFLSENDDVVVRGNTFEEGARIREAVLFDISGGRLKAVGNLVFDRNVFPRGQYGVGASGVGEGLVAWQAGALGASQWTGNAFVGRATVTYPPGTTWHATLADALGSAGIARARIDAGVSAVVIAR
ncbi:MAG: right-handed parallel beta-helix repeat-containing protein [Gemmatimonadaceae bacterium]|nr:right-handed parallel beta-helix repeat-containing protein [Gemmatimonadaceae bacterium]